MTTKILDFIGNLDSAGGSASRRDAFQQVARHGTKFALAAMTPLVATSCAIVGSAVAPNTGLAIETLTFALMLEELEHDFYVKALAAPGLIPSSDRVVFEQIGKHEGAHVTFLTTGIIGIGGAPKPTPQFDFTAGGRYPGVFSNYRTFLELSQTFEETGVKAYKGQAGNLITSSALLTAALRIHSVEARHAAEIRRLRGEKAWTGAFDEALTKEQVLAMVSPFIRKTA